jgi:hypothetical protein
VADCGTVSNFRVSIASCLIFDMLNQMHTLKTPNATVFHHSDFTEIVIRPTEGLQGPGPIDLMDIKEIYAAFFRQYLIKRIEQLGPDDVIKLGYHVGEKYA